MKKDEKVKVEVATYNWGPCLIKVKIYHTCHHILVFMINASKDIRIKNTIVNHNMH